MFVCERESFIRATLLSFCFNCMQQHFGNMNVKIFVMPIKHLKTEPKREILTRSVDLNQPAVSSRSKTQASPQNTTLLWSFNAPRFAC